MEFQRESIFSASLRSFAKVFFGMMGFFVAFVVIAIIWGSASVDNITQESTKITFLPDADWKKETTSITSPVILELKINGVIGDPKSITAKDVQNILIDSRDGLFKNNRVKAILLHLNTPGGTVVDADNIYRMLKAYKEKYNVPIYAFIDGLCASGGVYVSCAADKIFTSNASMIGSVGVVIGPFFNVVDGMNRLGIIAETITAGLNKDMLSPFRPWTSDESASVKAITNFFYNQFVEIVTSNRPMMIKEKLINEYGAKVFDPITAKEYGYVDVVNSSRNEALFALLQEAKIDPKKGYQVVELESKTDWFSKLASGKSFLFDGKIEHSLSNGTSAIKDQVAYLYQPFNY